MPTLDDTLTIGYFDGSGLKEFNNLGETSAWNWHMGCKLQWVGDTDKVIFNDHVDDTNIARLIDVNTRQETQMSDAIGSISPDGKWGVGYSFSRVQSCMPGYGYIQEVKELDIDDNVIDTGVYKIDLETGSRTDILSIEELANTETENSMNGMKHYVTHTVISPDSNRFIFLHRWINPQGPVDKRYSRLVVADSNGRIENIFRTDGMVSHIGWQDSSHVIAYCRVPNFDDKYVIFQIGKPDLSKIIGKTTLTSDGHPSFNSSGRWMVTDAYPDRRRTQSLILFDTQNNCKYDISKLYQPKEFQSPSHHLHWGCDLHPRWDRKSEMICFDATYNNIRSLCTINLDLDILQDKLKYLSKTPES